MIDDFAEFVENWMAALMRCYGVAEAGCGLQIVKYVFQTNYPSIFDLEIYNFRVMLESILVSMLENMSQ